MSIENHPLFSKTFKKKNIVLKDKISAHDSRAVANEFVKRYNKIPDSLLTLSQLSHMVYIAHGWNLAINNKPLIKHNVFSFGGAPMVPEVFLAYKGWGEGKCFVTQCSVNDKNIEYKEEFNADEKLLINDVFAYYKKFDSLDIARFVKAKNSPWMQFKKEKKFCDIIPDSAIKNYYRSLNKKENNNSYEN